MTPAALDALAELHRTQRLRLATTVGKQGWAHADGDPDALVGELIRFARIGALASAIALDRPRRRIGAVVREIGGAPS